MKTVRKKSLQLINCFSWFCTETSKSYVKILNWYLQTKFKKFVFFCFLELKRWQHCLIHPHPQDRVYKLILQNPLSLRKVFF